MSEVTGETLTYALRMIWYALLVTADVTITSELFGGVTLGMKQALLIKSCLLFGALMLVMRVQFPTRGNTGGEQETA